MKSKHIILRLCLFLFALVLAAPAWSKSDTWSATNRNKNEAEGTRHSNDNVVTVTWTNCKASGAVLKKNRNFEFKSGGTATITCASGWRVRAISFSGDLKNVGNISCSSDGSLYTGNGSTGISCYDAPKQSITIRTNGDCEFVNYTIEYVQESSVGFKSASYEVKVDQQYATALTSLVNNPYGVTTSFSIDKTNIAAINYNYFKGVGVGSATLTVKGAANANYAASSATATINVSRNDISPTLSWTSKSMKAWETPDVPAVQGLPTDYSGTVSWTSSDEGTAKIQNNKIVFGGTGYNKSATITVTLPQTNKYNAKQLTYTVSVDNEMHIATKTDWEQFCNQVNNLNNGSIKATLTANITDPVNTFAGKTNAPYSGSFEGGNHSIALDLYGGDYTAPFSVADGATIRNLTVTGSVATPSRFVGSFVGLVQGKAVAIEHCQSSVTITANRALFIGGLVGKAATSVKINNCIFSGSMSGENTHDCGGLVGWMDGGGSGNTISNCLVTATYNVSTIGFNAVAGNAKNATISNVYILNPLGTVPAGVEPVSADQIKSGYAAYKLQNAQKSQVWGQRINVAKSDAAPLFYTDPTTRVYAATFRSVNDNNKVLVVRYCNPGQTPAELTQDEIMAYIQDKGLSHYITYQKPTLSPQGNADSYIDVKFTDRAYLEINNAAAWQTFCDYVNNVSPKVSAKMTSNVTLTASSPMAGTTQAYAGKFDGGGYTLTVAYEGTGQATAPFNQVAGATIENLKTAGTVEQEGTKEPNPQSHASGLVGSADGVTINNCEVAVAISYSVAGKNRHSGGFVGHGRGSVIKMNNCKFSGSFSAPNGNKTSGIAGLVGWAAGQGSSFTNCYVAGKYTNIQDVHPLVYTTDPITVTSSNNFYCFNGIGANKTDNKGDATAVTAEQAKSGSVTYALQHGTGAQYWSQSLPDESEPMLVFSGEKKVNKVEFVYNDVVMFTRYANTGGRITGVVPTMKDFLGADYNDSYYYESFSFNPAFDGNSVVSQDMKVTGILNYAKFFTVNSKATWDQFCKLVNGGNSKLAAKMTADVNEAVSTMAGTSKRPYQGSFDGQGHTLTLSISTETDGTGPFAFADGATIKDLRTTGSIWTSRRYCGSIVGEVNNSLTTVSNCQSDVNIHSGYHGDATHGGIVGLANGPVSIENCAFTGNIIGDWTTNCAGILGWAGTSGNIIKNCLYTGTMNIDVTMWGQNSEPIARNSDHVTISNTYYLNAPHETSNGVKVTEEQLKNGEVASKLQGNQNESVWAFRLGEGTMLDLFSHPKNNGSEANVNYVYYSAGSWHCDYYRLTDGAAYQVSYVDFRADKITHLRSLTAGRPYTWCQPYAVTYSDDMPFKAYMLSRTTGGNAVFSQVSNGSPLYALMPYLIVMKDSRERIDYDQSAIVKSFDTSLGYVQQGDIKMMGTVKTISNDEASQLGAFTLQDDGSWRKVIKDKDNTAYIPPFRAYLTVSGLTSGAKIGSVFSDGTTTGVENIILKNNDGTTHIYDLNGIDRGTDFNSLPTGIYIRGGKKVVKR
ncbi:MAG: hypothetical protein LKE41_10705 [Prevotella sp.]|jgi:hypothetical protein|nr:hypothetical protein [Prevotella sp.]MCI2081007.1 hypothetical protein [Prevotella sp.]MCI2102867.1 hypothetical protein [Prevotella sp.]